MVGALERFYPLVAEHPPLCNTLKYNLFYLKMLQDSYVNILEMPPSFSLPEFPPPGTIHPLLLLYHYGPWCMPVSQNDNIGQWVSLTLKNEKTKSLLILSVY